MPTFTDAYQDLTGAGRGGLLTSYQHQYDSVQAAGLITIAGRTWQFSSSNILMVRVWNPRPFRSTHAFVINGDTVSGNVDIGVYDAGGSKIATTGSTAMAGASQVQFFTLAAMIPAGQLFLAMGGTSMTATFAYPSPSAAFWPQNAFTMGGFAMDAGGGIPLPTSLYPDTSIVDEQHSIFGVVDRWPA